MRGKWSVFAPKVITRGICGRTVAYVPIFVRRLILLKFSGTKNVCRGLGEGAPDLLRFEYCRSRSDEELMAAADESVRQAADSGARRPQQPDNPALPR
jgi:hypothetical protein